MAKVKKKMVKQHTTRRSIEPSTSKTSKTSKGARKNDAPKKEKERDNGQAKKVKASVTKHPVAINKPSKPVLPKKLSAEMAQIRSRLTSMLTDLRKDIDHEVRGASERDLAHINDTSDMASDSAEGDLSLRIAESETAEAGEIERAIEKIDTGTYGICETCNKPIGVDRLQFLPYSTLCIKCQALAEIRKRSEGDELEDLAEGIESDSENN